MIRPLIGFVPLAIALLAGAYLACVGDSPATGTQGDAGTESGGGEGGADGAGGDGGLAMDADPSLGCPSGCLPPAPPGWTGPSAVYDGPPASKPASCPLPYTQLEIDGGHQGLSAPAAVCDCGSATLQGAKCSARVEGWNGTDCTAASTGPFNEGTATSGACLGITDTLTHLMVSTPTIDRGTCSFGPPTATLPAPTFQKLDVACGLPLAGGCGARVDCTAAPAPAAPFSRVCIHKDGNALCPSADYAKRFVAFRTVVEGRSCEPCSGTPVDGGCGNLWGFSSSNQCLTALTPPTNLPANQCAPWTSPSQVDIRAMAPSGIGCAQDGGVPKGAPTSADPITFCCNN